MMPTAVMLVLLSVRSTYLSGCCVWESQGCETSSDCCSWNTTGMIRIQSCGHRGYCGCVVAGGSCWGGYRCCDGSICDLKCPPAPQFHYCEPGNQPACQTGLECTVDCTSTRYGPVEGLNPDQYGRCL